MVDFNNQWYQETCLDAGWNPNTFIAQTSIDLARKRAVDMKKYMDAKKAYADLDIHKQFDKQIKRLNEERIEFMLNALLLAEVSAENGKGFDQFVERQYNQRKILLR